MAATRKRSGWSDIRPELLELVLRRSAFRDYLNCRQVCRPWRSIVNDAMKNKCPPAPQFPYLLLLPSTFDFKKDPATILDITGQNNLQKLMIPHVSNSYYADVRLEEDGWLMFQDTFNFFWICNPVSREKYKLPRLPAQHTDQNRIHIYQTNVAFSSQNMLAVISFCYCDKKDGLIPQLCFCRVDKDKSWTHIQTSESPSKFKDIMLLGWKLYIMKADSVVIFNLKDPKAITVERLVMQLPKLDGDDDRERLLKNRLARGSTCGEVLLVIYTIKNSAIEEFHIFKLDMSGSKWIKVDSLSGRVLFLDCAGARVISSANLNVPPEFIGGGGGNCVVFSLDRHFGIFFLKEKTIQPLNVYHPLLKTSQPILWFTPCPW